jgi:hypothetical protein
LHVELGLAGGLLILWTFLPHGLWHHVGFVFFAWPLIAYVLRQRRQTSDDPTRSRLATREEWRAGARNFALVIPMLLYVGWARLVGQHPLVTLGSLLFFLGTSITLPSLWAPAQRYLVGWGVGLMLAGLVMPLAFPFSAISADVFIGAAILLGGGWGAVMLSRGIATAPQAR